MLGRRSRSAVLLGAAALVTTAAGASASTAAAGPSEAMARSAAPSVSRVTPAAGTTVGGARIAIRGTGFSHVTAVHFGSRAGTAIHVVSPTKIAITTPRHRAGTASVRVTTSAGTSAYRRTDHYTFRAPLVVLDPGHNGGNASHPSKINRLVPAGYGQRKPCNTTGTATNSGYPEHAFTWDVAKRVRVILRKYAVRVLLTRSNDTGVGPCVDRRARIESTKGTAAAVAIHADGAPASGHGFHVNEAGRRPVGASRATVAKSTRLGQALHKTLARSSGLVPSTYIGKNGYVRRTDFAGLNLSTSPTSFLELGNMRNARDAARLHSAAGRQRIAAAIAAGLLSYLRG